MRVVDDEARRRLSKEIRGRHKEALALSHQADDHIERHFIKRMSRLADVRRFIVLWTLLFVVLFLATFLQFRNLSHYYQSLSPVSGGLYNEGVVGTFTNANPLYASGAADTAVSHLVFSGLFKYDNKNQLTGDLAKDYVISSGANQYIVHLRKNVKWHDGRPFTADDVVFTYNTIQNIEAQSSLYSSWQGITVTKLNDYAVSFNLPNSLSSFPYSMTNGIVPAHILAKVTPEQLRSNQFNTSPIGTGPFVWKYVQVIGASADRQQRVTLAANKHYWPGRPKLDGFSIITFSDDKHLMDAFRAKQLNAMSGLEIEPADMQSDANIHTYVTPLTSAVMAFFNNSRPILNDPNVRRALVSSINRKPISNLNQFPVQSLDAPLLRSQLGYDATASELPYNFAYASQLLDQAGWVKGSDGIRTKAGKRLAFDLVSQDTHDYTAVASYLQKSWRRLGIKVDNHYFGGDELQTSVIGNHNYDVLLYGISLGVDPDVFAYWGSSQASLTSQGHLNLSEYKSPAADQALEAGRTRADASIRIIKYKAFLDKWKEDAPALALYQPNYLYITRGAVFNFQRKADNNAADRFNNVDQWMIRQKKQTI